MRFLEPLYSFCLDGIDSNDKELARTVRSFINVWVSTTIIMWLYVIFSYYVFSFPLVAQLGILYSIIHTLAPIVYRVTKSLVITGLVISLSGLAFQITYCYFNGGIDSPAVIWFAVHPVIISFFASQLLIILSVGLNAIVVGVMTYLTLTGFFPADPLPENITDVMRISSLVGLDIVIAVYTIVFIRMNKEHSQELAGRNKLIENLMRIMGHDIKNNLNATILTSQELQQEIKDDNSKQLIDKIIKSSWNIRNITNSVTEWMMAYDQASSLKITELSLNSVIDYIEDAYTEELIEKKIRFDIDVECPLNTKIMADHNALFYQVLNNIFFNAIKFSPENSELMFLIQRNDKSVVLKLIDQGIGMPEHIINNLFSPSRNSTREGTNGEKGTGFGMPIVKVILDAMNSSIKVKSKCEKKYSTNSGTEIAIKIPAI